MESYNKEKFLVEEYLEQTKSEVQNRVNIDGTKANPPPLWKRTVASIVNSLIPFVAPTYVLNRVFRIEHGLSFLLYFINILYCASSFMPVIFTQLTPNGVPYTI